MKPIANYQLLIPFIKKTPRHHAGGSLFWGTIARANPPLIPEISSEMELLAWATLYPGGAIL
jgi:hypothetical protein